MQTQKMSSEKKRGFCDFGPIIKFDRLDSN